MPPANVTVFVVASGRVPSSSQTLSRTWTPSWLGLGLGLGRGVCLDLGHDTLSQLSGF